MMPKLGRFIYYEFYESILKNWEYVERYYIKQY